MIQGSNCGKEGGAAMTIRDFLGGNQYDSYVADAENFSVFGIKLSTLEKEDLYAVIAFLMQNYDQLRLVKKKE